MIHDPKPTEVTEFVLADNGANHPGIATVAMCPVCFSLMDLYTDAAGLRDYESAVAHVTVGGRRVWLVTCEEHSVATIHERVQQALGLRFRRAARHANRRRANTG